MKPHLRKDPFSPVWVIINDERQKRPNDYVDSNIICPFCPGNEKETPPSVFEKKKGNEWYIRVVENKYPAVLKNVKNLSYKEGIFTKYFFNGRHEVIIETPLHNARIYEIEHLNEVLNVFKLRMKKLYDLKGIEYVMLFRNYGINAGASLKHPHSQIVALPFVPVRVMDEVEKFKLHFEKENRCLMCDVINCELKLNKRIIFSNKYFLVFAPFASRFNFEMWVAPIDHSPNFYDEEKFVHLAEALKLVFKKLHLIVPDISYNIIFHTAPKSNNFFHWHIEILPKLAMPAGFEWGSGFYINSISPEEVSILFKKS